MISIDPNVHGTLTFDKFRLLPADSSSPMLRGCSLRYSKPMLRMTDQTGTLRRYVGMDSYGGWWWGVEYTQRVTATPDAILNALLLLEDGGVPVRFRPDGSEVLVNSESARYLRELPQPVSGELIIQVVDEVPEHLNYGPNSHLAAAANPAALGWSVKAIDVVADLFSAGVLP